MTWSQFYPVRSEKWFIAQTETKWNGEKNNKVNLFTEKNRNKMKTILTYLF